MYIDYLMYIERKAVERIKGDQNGRALERERNFEILYNYYLQKPNSTLWVQNLTAVQPK